MREKLPFHELWRRVGWGGEIGKVEGGRKEARPYTEITCCYTVGVHTGCIRKKDTLLVIYLSTKNRYVYVQVRHDRQIQVGVNYVPYLGCQVFLLGHPVL